MTLCISITMKTIQITDGSQEHISKFVVNLFIYPIMLHTVFFLLIRYSINIC